ncbi:hypothetical protein [Halapricum desulfuricans]|uniref:Cell surface protein n=1 Tax=Halapricum desulfuricans TaxID=2841257 RepID=A0A897N703_9EURY|nr:hypothetical protein [Halapricum desulfuricans]QSG10160.1 Cell surface protein [Halapricum desulfuricans]
MTRTSLLVAVLVASTALLVSTGAVPFSDGTDEISGVNIEMSPADGPNGQYAVIDETGELALVLSGENPDLEVGGVPGDAVTPLDRVFTITYTGDLFARVWITDDAEDVRFYRGGDPDETLEGSDNAVTLGPNETLKVGLRVDTRGDHDVESASTFGVSVEQATPTSAEISGDSSAETPTTQTAVEAPTESTMPLTTETTQPSNSPTDGEVGNETTTEAGPVPPVGADTTTGTATGGDDSPAGGLPAEVGGFDLAVAVPALSLLALALLALAWYRRRSDR